MKNEFLEYYGQHHISPVKQDISNLKVHYERRRKLYRQCGIPVIAFRNAEVLEIGPGGGYNTLAFFHWGSKHVDLVEANQKGIDDMRKLFAEQEVSKEQYQIFQCRAEEYYTEKKYDVVIAEGFLPWIENQDVIIRQLQQLTADDGIIVITCIDHVGLFIETMKRLLGWAMASNLELYEDKVRYLAGIFGPQLANLRGVSRSAEDWVKDMVLNPAGSNNLELSINQAIQLFEENFDILGSSPNMFTDYSWYKDIWFDYISDYKQQFRKKRLSFLMANMPEQTLHFDQADELVKCFTSIRKLAAAYEKDTDIKYIIHILEEMGKISEVLCDFDADFENVFCDIQRALSDLIQRGAVELEKYPHLFRAFGRTQQYIAFMKK